MGLMMGASQDFTLRPVHVHVNLLGWTTLALAQPAFAGQADPEGPATLAWRDDGVFVASSGGSDGKESDVKACS